MGVWLAGQVTVGVRFRNVSNGDGVTVVEKRLFCSEVAETADHLPDFVGVVFSIGQFYDRIEF